MNPDALQVHAPTTVVFLCGGVIDANLAAPVMLRDAFYRICKNSSLAFNVVLAEDAEPLTAEAGYNDLFRFESDIAQIVGLILLFAESPGSLAELGAFSALETVAPSLLAVLDDVYYNAVSFIRNGPIRFLENEYGEEWILVLDRADVGISATGKIENLNTQTFEDNIIPAVRKRLESKSAWSKLDRANSGHAILFMTGLCQEFGALTIREIRNYLNIFGLKSRRISNFIYCAQLLGWIKKVRKGNHIFYVATSGESALDYKLVVGTRDKVRWRSDIRAYWRKNDTPRLKAITSVLVPPPERVA